MRACMMLTARLSLGAAALSAPRLDAAVDRGGRTWRIVAFFGRFVPVEP